MKRQIPVVGRNEPCPCGSGKKYKHCHGAKTSGLTTGQRIAIGLIGALIVGGLWLGFSDREHVENPRGVWSPEHGHYH